MRSTMCWTCASVASPVILKIILLSSLWLGFLLRSRRGDIGAEYPQIHDQGFELSERCGDLGIAARRLQIEIKTVLPRAAVHGAAFDLHQVDIATRKGLERVNQCAGAMIELKDEREFVRVFGRIGRGRK